MNNEAKPQEQVTRSSRGFEVLTSWTDVPEIADSIPVETQHTRRSHARARKWQIERRSEALNQTRKLRRRK